MSSQKPGAPSEIELNVLKEKEPMNLESGRFDVIVKGGKFEAPDSYWRQTICILTIPFLLIGFPTHLIYPKPEPGSPKQTKINSPVKWFKFIFNPSNYEYKILILLTLILILIGATLVTFVVWSLAEIFYQLIILGDLTPDIALSSHNLVRGVPGVVPVLYGWIRGYNISSFIRSFDSTRIELKNEINSGGEDPSVIEPGTRSYGKRRKTRTALFWLYFAIVSAQLIHLVSERTTGTGTYVDHVVDILHSLVFPVYCCFCWALASEFEILASHLELLHLNAVQPSFQVFVSIKTSFKKIVAHVQDVNVIFNKFMTWVIILTLISIIGKVIFATIYVFGISTAKAVMSIGFSVFGKFAKGFDFDGDGIGDEGAAGNSTTAAEAEQVLSTVLVRTGMAYYISAIIQGIVIYYTISQVTRVNDRCKYLQVLLNDYGTEVADQMTPEIYNGFRLLKFYMHSTNEQNKSGLLKILLLNIVPAMKSRVQGYSLRS